MMTADQEKLPQKISDYVNEHFREEFLFEVKEIKQVEGRPYYTAEVTQDGYIYTLRFNAEGDLISKEAEEAFPPDAHDEI